MRYRLLLLACLLWGAADCTCGGDFLGRKYACTSDGDCADGYACVNQVCLLPGADAGPGAADGGGTPFDGGNAADAGKGSDGGNAMDAGARDAGASTDAGPMDAGATDAGSTDAGPPCDATTCPSGCCLGNACQTSSTATCGTGGAACLNCGGQSTCVSGMCGCQIPSDNLAGFWTFDDGAGTTAGDSSGNGDNGNINGTVAWGTGHIAGALGFDAGAGAVDFGNGPPINFDESFSFSFWMNVATFDGISQQGIFTKGAFPDTGWDLLDDGNNAGDDAHAIVFRIYPSNASVYLPRSGVNDGRWHHLAGTFDENTLSIYLDGALGSSVGVNGMGGDYDAGTTHPLLFRGWGFGFPMMFDQARFYSRALTAPEVTALSQETAQSCAVTDGG